VKLLVVAIHDVAPSTLAEVGRWRELAAGLAPAPVSLLVVPRYHGRESWRAGPARAWLRERERAGDELVLHGYAHMRPGGRDGRELAGRPGAQIADLLHDALEEMARAGIPTDGFIAPSYSHPAAVDGCCRDAGIGWWATRWTLSSPAGHRPLPSLGLGASTPGRRLLSPWAARLAARALAAAPAVRLDLHPADLRHPRLARTGRDLLEALLDQGRHPVTHRELRDVPRAA
jgi:predicted deacetylase